MTYFSVILSFHFSLLVLAFFQGLPNINTVLGVATGASSFNALIQKCFGLNELKMFISTYSPSQPFFGQNW